jgi:hypothetical protein
VMVFLETSKRAHFSCPSLISVGILEVLDRTNAPAF